jgi:hypothetical protein
VGSAPYKKSIARKIHNNISGIPLRKRAAFSAFSAVTRKYFTRDVGLSSLNSEIKSVTKLHHDNIIYVSDLPNCWKKWHIS